jgi:hypothetical protein
VAHTQGQVRRATATAATRRRSPLCTAAAAGRPVPGEGGGAGSVPWPLAAVQFEGLPQRGLVLKILLRVCD